MTLARRLTISIFGVLALFAVNVVTFAIGNHAIRESLDAVSDSVRGQVNAGELRQRMDTLHKQLLVLLTLRESAGQGASEAEADRARAEITAMGSLVTRMSRNTTDVSRPAHVTLQAATDALFGDWNHLLDELRSGRKPALSADQLKERHAGAALALEAFDTAVTEVSREESGAVEQTGRITGRVVTAVFLASIALTAMLGFLLMRHTNESLFRLRRGTVRIGRGDLEYRIPVLADDEFGQLAAAFNDMAGRLRDAVHEVNTAREQADRANAAKSGFLANMSHELRTPLNAIIGYSEMLVEMAEDEPELRATSLTGDMQRILTAGRHLLSLINNVLDLAKIETGKMTLHRERFDALAVLRELAETLHALAARNRNRISVESVLPEVPIHTDEIRFRQIFANLLSNACKFTENGSIRVEAKIFGHEGTQWLRFDVRDTGIGMTAEQCEAVFEPFVQADSSTTKKYGGTGLGLSLCREFCTLLGGSIGVESEPGLGSCFFVELPVDAIAAETTVTGTQSAAEAQEGVGGQRVLVIDDDADARALTARALEQEGCTVLEAASGNEGLRMAKEQQPDMIVLDLVMPEVDGWTVLSVLKDNPETRHIPVVLQSMLDARVAGIEQGAAEVLEKPVNRQRLAQALQRLAPADRSGHVLLIESASPARAELVEGLERQGWYVSSTEQPGEALAIARQSPPDMILLSLALPGEDVHLIAEGLGRSDALRQTPVYVMEGNAQESDARAVLEAQLDRLVFTEGSTGEVLARTARREGPTAAPR